MIDNSLNNPIKVRLTSDQTEALEILKRKGFNKSKFIRLAVEEKLYRDFRKIISEINEKYTYGYYEKTLQRNRTS